MKKDKKIWLLFSCIFIAVIGLGVQTYLFQGENVGFNTEKATVYSEGWYYKDGNIDIPITLPTYLEAETNQDVVIYNKFPEQLTEGATFCIRSSCQSIQVKVGEDIIYERGKDASTFLGKSPGSFWNMIRILPEYAGKDFSIIVNSPYKAYAGAINQVTYGSKSANMFYLIEHYLLGLILACTIILVGIILIILHFFMKAPGIQNHGLIYLGFFAVLVGIWCATESKMPQFLTGNQTLVSALPFYTNLLFPIPILMFYDTIYKAHHKKILPTLYIAFMINFIITVLLQCTGTKDFFEIVISVHILMAVSIVAVIIQQLLEIFKYKNKEVKSYFYPMLILALAGIIELTFFYINSKMNTSQFIRVGILLYLLAIAITFIIKFKKTMEANRELKYYEKLAYCDLLTGGRNRTYYYKEIEEIFAQSKQSDLWLVLSDVNNLKEINDKDGHTEGDIAIRKVYTFMNECFEAYGKSFRIGGDEFAVLSTNAEYNCLQEAAENFYKKLKDGSKELSYELSVALSFDSYKKEDDEDFDDLYRRVDAAMYERKREMKK